jgi:uncharacterized protein involved in type VI secretion and phage assembly
MQRENVTPMNGMKVATVIEVADPLGLGRVLIRFSDIGSEMEVWARVAGAPQSSRGTVAKFEVSDEVLVAFAGGDPRSPFVIGKLWQGNSPPPTQAGTNPVIHPRRPLLARTHPGK